MNIFDRVLAIAALLCGLGVLGVLPGPAYAGVPNFQPIVIEGEDGRIAKVMALYEIRSTLSNHDKAAKEFSAIAAAHPKNLWAQLWCARTAYYSAHRHQDDKDTMKSLAKLGDSCGQRLKIFSGTYEADLWIILSRFKMLATSNWIPPLGKIEKLARELEGIARKNPKRYGTYLLLGAIFRELPGWPVSIGDDELAMKYLLKGNKLASRNAELLLELAATQNAVDDEEAAKKTYEKCIAKGNGASDLRFETAEARKWAKKMLGELE